MHVLILPSWYPGRTTREGLFIFEQAIALGKCSGFTISILNWGPNEFVLKIRSPLVSLGVITRFPFQHEKIIRHSDNVTEYRMPHLTWSSLILKGNYASLIEKFKKAVSRVEKDHGKLDIIHAHVTFPAGYLALSLSKSFSIPYIITEHSGPFPFKEFITGTAIRRIITEPLGKAARIIAVSNWLSLRVSENSETPVSVIPNSVDTAIFTPSAPKQELSRKPLMFCLSFLTEEKGIGDLLKAIKLLRDKGQDFTIRIGGTGPMQGHFQRLASNLGIKKNVVWLGALNRSQVLREYQDCDFFVMPSRLETLSMVILEAIACGKPVVATDCGGPSDLINEVNGLLVKPGNYCELALGIERMLLSYKTYDQISIRENCIEKYSTKVIVSRIRNIYQEVTSS
jgi:glycosyltransferase involved in cell wall biosynthesis